MVLILLVSGLYPQKIYIYSTKSVIRPLNSSIGQYNRISCSDDEVHFKKSVYPQLIFLEIVYKADKFRCVKRLSLLLVKSYRLYSFVLSVIDGSALLKWGKIENVTCDNRSISLFAMSPILFRGNNFQRFVRSEMDAHRWSMYTVPVFMSYLHGIS